MLSRPKRVLLLLVVALTTFIGSCYVHRRLEQKYVLQTHNQLMKCLAAGDSEQAYALTTNQYRAKHTLQEFKTSFAYFKGQNIDVIKEPFVRSCCSLGTAEVYAFKNPGWFQFLNGPTFHYSKENGQWRFTGETNHYMD